MQEACRFVDQDNLKKAVQGIPVSPSKEIKFHEACKTFQIPRETLYDCNIKKFQISEATESK